MVNTTYNSAEYMIDKLQQLKKNETKLKFHKNVSNYYYDTLSYFKIKMDEGPLSKYAQSTGQTYHEFFSLFKLLQTKPQVKINILVNKIYMTHFLKIEVKKKSQIIKLKIMKLIILILKILSLPIIIYQLNLLKQY